ncbi:MULTISPECIES: MarR family winged helix-turn-helix transcriptional regulator [Mumia]|uniref:MarR family winged helix-turn-helix transcriptional regulator n=1 Tax=Mumia xiangluensis TaxID=1678900 RepID=A0ABW1QG88_9ACTN|nr:MULTISPECIES: MarR family transcriptional regulator [Mumia]
MTLVLTDETAERVAAALGKLGRVLRSSAHRWDRLDIGVRRTDVPLLRRLQHDGEQRLSDLAEPQCVSVSVISRQVAALEHDGLVERRVDPTDARVVLIRLSDSGRERLADITRRYATFVHRALDEFDDSEARRMAELIDLAAERMSAELDSPPNERTPDA